MPHCLGVCLPLWSRAARPRRHALDSDVQHGLKPARGGPLQPLVELFHQPGGHAEHCLHRHKTHPASMFGGPSAGPPASRHNTRYRRVCRFLRFAALILVELFPGAIWTHAMRNPG